MEGLRGAAPQGARGTGGAIFWDAEKSDGCKPPWISKLSIWELYVKHHNHERQIGTNWKRMLLKLLELKTPILIGACSSQHVVASWGLRPQLRDGPPALPAHWGAALLRQTP